MEIRLGLGASVRRVVATGAMVTGLSVGIGMATAASAHAAGPQAPHGTCSLGHSDVGRGATGCAGNIGGYVMTKPGVICFNEGPFSTYFCPSNP